jgi:hypothetical protein
MIAAMSNTADYYRPPLTIDNSASTPTLKDTMSALDLVPDYKDGIAVSSLRQIDPGLLKAVRPPPEILDQWTAMWLSQNSAVSRPMVSDDAPQNTYAEVKVGGNVVATLFNGGSATMTMAAAAKIGDLKDPAGLTGPDLAQWRAEAYAGVLGGTVEKAATAISQSQWTPHPSQNADYTRAQLDQGLAGYVAETQKLVAGRTPNANLSA